MGYPGHLLARAPAPPYEGEAEHSLWHFSEDPRLVRFEPHRAGAAREADEPLVWAVDARHAPMFWFPRDCPRGCVWAGPDTTDADRERFFGQTIARRIHVIESSWLARTRACRLYAYRLPLEPFAAHAVGGYWIAREPVEAVERVELEDLVAMHADAGIELRITPSVWPFWRRVVASTLEFSGSRLRNAAPDPDPDPDPDATR